MASQSSPGHADVIGAKVRNNTDGTYSFDVTVHSQDSGWSSYADAFEILGPDGTVLGTRVLAHPHETEQPFTRSLGGVTIPPGITDVSIRAHHKEFGYSGKVLTVGLPT